MSESFQLLPLEGLLDSYIGGLWGEEPGRSEVDVKVMRITELGANGTSELSTSAIRSLTHKQVASRKLHEGDLVLEKSGGGPKTPVGRVALISALSQDVICSNFMLLMRPNHSLVLSKYLHHFLTYLHVTGQTIPLQSSSTNIRNISTPDYMQVQVPVPSLDEQKQIVETLDDHLSRLDKALAEVSSAAKKTEAFIKSYLLSLVQGSASICHDSGSWQKREIGSLGKWRGGGTPSKSNPLFWLDGQIPWLTAKDMKTFRISDTQDHITEAGVAGSSANLFPSKAVVVVTRSGILEWKLPVAVTEVPVTVNQDLKALVCNADVLPEWAAYSILGFEHRILEECRKAGTTVANLNFEDFLKFEIFVPTIKRQQELSNLIQESVDYLDSVRARVNTLQTTLTDMRRSILKDAFLGALVKE